MTASVEISRFLVQNLCDLSTSKESGHVIEESPEKHEHQDAAYLTLCLVTVRCSELGLTRFELSQ